MNYQVGDLFCAVWDENHLYLLTEIPVENVYIITCMRTHRTFGHKEEGIELKFRKIA